MADPVPRVGIGVIVVRDGRLLLGLRAGAHGAGTWALPGGHLEFGETPEQCAARELREETGLELLGGTAGPAVNDVFEAERRHYVTWFVVASGARGEPERREPEKCLRWEWFRWSELPEALFQPLDTLRRTGYVPPGAGAASISAQVTP